MNTKTTSRSNVSPTPELIGVRKLKWHFLIGFLSGVLVVLGMDGVATDLLMGRSWWESGVLLLVFGASAVFSWLSTRGEWKRVAALLGDEPPSEPQPLPEAKIYKP